MSGDLRFGVTGADAVNNSSNSNTQILSSHVAFELALPSILNKPTFTGLATSSHSPSMSFPQPPVTLTISLGFNALMAVSTT